MESRLATVLNHIQEFCVHHLFEEITINNFLASINTTTHSPLINLPAKVDLSSRDVVCTVILHIIENLTDADTFDLKMSTDNWREFADICIRIVDNHDPGDLDNLNIRLSFLVNLSRQPRHLEKLFHIVTSISAGKSNVNLPSGVLAFLTSKRCRDAFENAFKPKYDPNYPVPPNIILVENNQLRAALKGWVCFNESIAINSNEIPQQATLWSSTRIIKVSNLIAHETQHGIFRSSYDDFNIHTPDKMTDLIENELLVEENESGRRLEKQLWYGHCLAWHRYKDTSTAVRKITNKILDDIQNSGTFELTTEEVEVLKSNIGTMESTSGGLFFDAKELEFEWW